MTALRDLLIEIIDYAGLFPPAALPLRDVVSNYRKYVPGNHNWLLARLIIPATKLADFAEVFTGLFPEGSGQSSWKISALIPAVDADDGAFVTALNAIESFNSKHDFAEVDTVEGKLPSAELITKTCDTLSDSLSAFLEIPHCDPDETITRLAAAGRANTFGKIRTGGVTPDLIPTTERVAHFISQCAKSRLGFKATAGLHHPLRGQFPLTYCADSDRSTMHGFINVFLAACFARKHAWSVTQLTEILECSDPTSFAISENEIAFKENPVSAQDIKDVRSHFAISFGSCSFVEPVDDLIQLGWLADAAKTV